MVAIFPSAVADVLDWDIVLLTPEERSRRETLAAFDSVERRDLSLTFSDDPMLDPDCLTTHRILPARNVARGGPGGIFGTVACSPTAATRLTLPPSPILSRRRHRAYPMKPSTTWVPSLPAPEILTPPSMTAGRGRLHRPG